MYGFEKHRVTRSTLINLAWSSPMRDLAKQFDLSDTGMKKVLTSHGIVCPPQGHWNRVRAGRTVAKPPKAPPRRPGERGYVLLDSRFKSLPRASPLPVEGPFASAVVPEDLHELRALELAAIGKPASAQKPTRYHPEIAALIKRDEIIAAKPVDMWGHKAPPPYASPFERRRLRILNAVYLTLNKRGHDGKVERYNVHLSFRVLIGDTSVTLELEEKGSRPQSQYEPLRIDEKRSANVPLMLTLRSMDKSVIEQWVDDGAGKLETKIASIAAGLIAGGERLFREGLRKDVEREEQMRLARITRDEEARQKAEAARLAALIRSGKLLSKAERLRQIVRCVDSAIVAGGIEVTTPALEQWRAWAMGQADKLDPIKSGQIFEHLPRGDRIETP